MKLAYTGTNLFPERSSVNADLVEWKEQNDIDALIINGEMPGKIPEGKTVLINSVTQTLAELGRPDWIRFNGWPGFSSLPCWEVAGTISENATKVFRSLDKKIIAVKDEPGLISARILSMIINEAFFALEEKISTEKEIDIAMKLGTNYPKGPFEWGEEIGYEKVYELLQKMAETDERYIPSRALKLICGK